MPIIGATLDSSRWMPSSASPGSLKKDWCNGPVFTMPVSMYSIDQRSSRFRRLNHIRLRPTGFQRSFRWASMDSLVRHPCMTLERRNVLPNSGQPWVPSILYEEVVCPTGRPHVGEDIMVTTERKIMLPFSTRAERLIGQE